MSYLHKWRASFSSLDLFIQPVVFLMLWILYLCELSLQQTSTLHSDDAPILHKDFAALSFGSRMTRSNMTSILHNDYNDDNFSRMEFAHTWKILHNDYNDDNFSRLVFAHTRIFQGSHSTVCLRFAISATKIEDRRFRWSKRDWTDKWPPAVPRSANCRSM